MANKQSLTEQEAIKMHVAGATVRHRSPFDHLVYPANEAPMTQAFIDEWAKPFYMMPLQTPTPEFVAACARVTPEVILQLLREFNWRPRVVAAHFIAIRREFAVQSELSTLFLKSEVCDAGRAYCLALARFGNQEAARTLCEYLDYYLTRTDLWFDQWMAMETLIYLDEEIGANFSAQFANLYQKFVADKPNWDSSPEGQHIRKLLACLDEIEQLVETARNQQ